jgi:hypothetical protein
MFEPTQPARRAVGASGGRSRMIDAVKNCLGTKKKSVTAKRARS